ncbi:MGH1-like glycoside hydrolase domain-containing protein [Colwellia sp. MB02u-9]|uniref:MGH1-like glycoside hydrolase domain-containing protein n=1 Tax=Colwellia sp. MB02u-9 TaxID=2759823 RepID=UPI0015F6572F|nr:trehalase family glycosidase [Colwellia sp. MB02u-9]MBA6295706.1 hypothetical protein [Colwellia sp. MB02u-9]
MKNNEKLIEQAKDILYKNDVDGYTVPTHGLYPFQWNWDAAITALGWMKTDESRAWLEIEMLLKGQWDNGMVPHIIFHQEVDSYFPGPKVWGVDKDIPTTAISQPPVLVSIVKMMAEQAKDQKLAQEKLTQMLPQLIAYHQWWYNDRDPENTGLVVSYHPWESGMDNSPAWDKSLAAVPPVTWQYKRKDLEHVDSDERPHANEYDRYLYLVDFFKKSNFDSEVIYRDCPYKMYDVGIISILHKATKDLVSLCQTSKVNEQHVTWFNKQIALTESAINTLWSDEQNSFLNTDAITKESFPVLTTGTLMAIYGELANKEQSAKLKILMKSWLDETEFGISSTYAKCAQYEPQRYWRGPVWLHINWLLALGAEHYGFNEESLQLKEASQTLIEKSGYFEYFNCETGAGCGGDDFSWTAAIALHWFL